MVFEDNRESPGRYNNRFGDFFCYRLLFQNML